MQGDAASACCMQPSVFHESINQSPKLLAFRCSTVTCIAAGKNEGHALDTSNTGRGLKQLPTDEAGIAAYIYNLLQGGQTNQAATAIAQAASRGGTGADAIATAIATASSQV